MSVIDAVDTVEPSIPEKRSNDGPVARGRLLRAKGLHVALCVLGILPWLLDLPAQLQAVGWGLWLPGAGFLSVPGLWWVFPVVVLLFAISFVAWFGSGMIVGPVGVWGIAAGAAGLAAHDAPADSAEFVVPAITAAFLLATAANRRRVLVAMRRRRVERNAWLPSAVMAARERAVAPSPAADRELSELQLELGRYALDRALGLRSGEPLAGFDRIDQFQTAALRYQLNQVGWLLGVMQRNFTPSFTGYVSEGQRRAIERYVERDIWGYWRWENAWGNLSADLDPAKKDNIMLTGYVNINTLLYENATDDHRYAQPGALPFRFDDRRMFPHDTHSIHQSLVDNFRGEVYHQPYCLFPCEPNWVYSSCNFRGLTAVRLHDTVHGTDDFQTIAPEFRRRLEEEFINVDGGMVALRSKISGHSLPFPVPDGTLVKMLAPLFPDLAERYWALARRSVLRVVDKNLQVVLKGSGIDYGNYGKGHIFTLDSILGSAREMGDVEAGEAAEAALDAVVGRLEEGGASWWHGSNMGNLMTIESHLGHHGSWRDAILTRPDAGVLDGPVLHEASYPHVLVARAVSDGRALDLVLVPGADLGSPQELSFARLLPGARYRLVVGDDVVAVHADRDGHGYATVCIAARSEIQLVPEA